MLNDIEALPGQNFAKSVYEFQSQDPLEEHHKAPWIRAGINSGWIPTYIVRSDMLGFWYIEFENQ